MTSVLIIYMKKHRKLGNTTSTNFYTSEFQLKSTEFPKESRQRKINTTFSNFRHQLFHEQPKSQQRYHSKDGKPYIEQLKFLSSKEDNFKLPQSVTKRSLSKNKEQSRLKIQEKVRELYNQHFQQVPANKQEGDKKKPYYQFAAAKRMKQTHNKNSMKDRLEKTALQKFNEAVLKENEQNQNVVSEKNAQSLYLLLKTARMNQLKSHNLKQHRITTQNQSEVTQQLLRKDRDDEQYQRANARKQSDNLQQSQNQSNKGKKIKEVAKSKQNLFKQFDEKSKNHTEQTLQLPEQNKRPDIPKPKVSVPHAPPAPAPAPQNPRPEVIKFQRVQCDNTKKEGFTSSEYQQSSDFGQQLGEQSKINFNLQIKSKQESKPQINQPPPILPQNNTRKQSIKLQQKSYASDEEKKETKNKINPEPKKPQVKAKKFEESDFDNIPSAQAVDKPATGKEINAQKQARKGSNEFISLNNNKIQKVLTHKHLDQPTIKTAPKINPPPRLPNLPENKPNTGKPAHPHPVEDDELEQIDFANQKNKKEQIKPIPSKKDIPQAPPNKQEEQKKDKNVKQQPKKVETASQPIQRQQQQDEQEESSQAQVENELTYYIQRIEDIGQYRINSKDVYNDQSIDKQLLQINKICAYYMAHQFLYLAKWTSNYFKSNDFINDFYTLTADDLKMLKERGQLEAQIQNLQTNIEQSKKLLKKCYEECKAFLKKQQQILVLDGKANYHIRCCATIIRQFKKVYDLLQKSPKNPVMLKRCVYLIEMYCALKLLNGEELKQYEQFEDIQNPQQHIETHKKHLLSL